MSTKSLIIDHKRIQQKINRIAHQIYENHYQEDELILVGVIDSGYILAERLKAVLESISPIKINLLSIKIDKKNPFTKNAIIEESKIDFDNKIVILIDDVLNSGRTLMYCAKALLDFPIKQLVTVSLVDRKHRSFPIRADYVGTTLATTMQEHISVEFDEAGDAVYLS